MAITFVMSYCLSDPNSWKTHEELTKIVYNLLTSLEGVKKVDYYYAIVGSIRWKRYWIIELENMSVREHFHSSPELFDALTKLTGLADPSTHSDMFWERHNIE